MKKHGKRQKTAPPKSRARVRPTSRRTPAAPKNADDFFRRSESFQDRWNSVIGVVSRMRAEKVSLQKASQDAGISPSSVKRWARSALQKRSNGKWVAKRSDRLLRVMALPTREGMREIATRDSRQASLIGNYLNAVHRYLETGDRSKLGPFQGKAALDANGLNVPLLTDLQELKRLGSAGDLALESIYRKG